MTTEQSLTSEAVIISELEHVHYGGHVEFRKILEKITHRQISEQHRKMCRLVISDARGLKRQKDPLVLRTIKHVRSEERRCRRIGGHVVAGSVSGYAVPPPSR